MNELENCHIYDTTIGGIQINDKMTVQKKPIFDIILWHIQDRGTSGCFHLAKDPLPHPFPIPTSRDYILPSQHIQNLRYTTTAGHISTFRTSVTPPQPDTSVHRSSTQSFNYHNFKSCCSIYHHCSYTLHNFSKLIVTILISPISFSKRILYLTTSRHLVTRYTLILDYPPPIRHAPRSFYKAHCLLSLHACGDSLPPRLWRLSTIFSSCLHRTIDQ